MLKNNWNTFKIYIVYLAKLLSNREATLSSENFENTSNFGGWSLILVAFKKSVNLTHHPANINLLNVNKRNTRKRSKIFLKLTVKTPERNQ